MCARCGGVLCIIITVLIGLGGLGGGLYLVFAMGQEAIGAFVAVVGGLILGVMILIGCAAWVMNSSE